MTNVCVIIPARGGSKRLKNKNIYPILGKPMVGWAIDACKKSSYNPDIWVSTDSEDVSRVAKQYGANVHIRDPELAKDHVYKQVAIRAAAQHIEKHAKKYDVYVSLQANSPEIKSHQIDAGIKKMLDNNKDEIFSVDNNLMQNAAFRIFSGDYVFQQDLSTNCGVIICESYDIHTLEDVQTVIKLGNIS